MKTKKQKLVDNARRTSKDNAKEIMSQEFFEVKKGFNYFSMRSAEIVTRPTKRHDQNIRIASDKFKL